jgi:hypothetical protein
MQYPAALLFGGRALAGFIPEDDAEERKVRDHFGVVGGLHFASGACAVEGAPKCTERTGIDGVKFADVAEMLATARCFALTSSLVAENEHHLILSGGRLR